MNITITDKRVTIEQDGVFSTHNLGNLRYYYTNERDSITLKDGSDYSATAPIDKIVVNGRQMTSGNIEDLLDDIFV